LISAVALYFALHDVHWSEVRQAIRGAEYPLIAAATILLVVTFVLRALRWRLALAGLPRLQPWHLFGTLNVSYFINNVLPFQTGDLWRAFLLSELAHISTTRTLSTVVVERIVDVLTLLLLLLLLAPFMDIPGWARAPSLTLAVLFSAAAIALILASSRRRLVNGLIDRLVRLAPDRSRPKLQQMAGAALDGVAVLTRPAMALRFLGYSTLVWLVAGGVVYLATLAFDLGLGYDEALFLLIVTTFGFFVPASPGSFGVYHAIVTGVLTSVFGVDKALAVSYALVVHLVFYLPPMFIGPAFLWQQRDLWRRRPGILKAIAELRGSEALEAGRGHSDG
jgi:uncharacterized protein (TIRG00374 family)